MTAARSHAAAGVGVGWRHELGPDLLADPGAVDFVELVAESVTGRAAEREARAVSEIWPVVVHGVKLSLGSVEGLDAERARRFAALARAVGACVVSEHVSFVRSGGAEIGHLTALPFTRAAVATVARNVNALRRLLPDVPLLLENVAWSLRYADDELDEATFYREVVRATGCRLLLDVANLYANACNARPPLDPRAWLAEFPSEDIGMLHVAGGVHTHGFYYDTHEHAVPDAVFELVAAVVRERPDVPILLERDGAYRPFAPIAGELARLRAVRAAAVPAPGHTPDAGEPKRSVHRVPIELGGVHPGETRLRAQQDAVARALVADRGSPPDPAVVALVGRDGLERSRDILRRKRWDDALPLLPSLAPHADAWQSEGTALLDAAPRAGTFTAAADAMCIAAWIAARGGDIGRAAERDAVALRARFVTDAEGRALRPRRGPYVARIRGRAGAPSYWFVKGIGGAAPVRCFQGMTGRIA